MRARSWMAALALIAGTSIIVAGGLPAQAPSPTQAPQPAPARGGAGTPATRSPAATPRPSGTHFPAIRLNLVIAGLGREGCEVEVKPANAGCKFRVAAPQHVQSDGRVSLQLRDVELRGADHTCTLAITVREPGQAPKTLYRGFRLAGRALIPPASSPSAAPPPMPSFTCYLNSRLAGVDGTRTRK